MKVGDLGIWKPIQTGIILSTKSAILLCKYLLEERNFEFVLLSRFSQDCLENIFSLVRMHQSLPSASAFKQNLRSIAISQFLNDTGVKNSSYEEDDRENMEGFLDYIIQKDPDGILELNNIVEETHVSPDEIKKVVLDYSDLNILYNIAGYILHSICNVSSTCSTCQDDIFADDPIDNYGKFVSLKEYKTETLCYASQQVFDMFIHMEKIFIIMKDDLVSAKENAMKKFSSVVKLTSFNLQNCHGIEDKIITRFVRFRLSISGIKRKR